MRAGLENDPRRRAPPRDLLRGARADGDGTESPRDPAWVRGWRTDRALSLRGAGRYEPDRPSHRGRRLVHIRQGGFVLQGRGARFLWKIEIPGNRQPG